MCDSAAGFSTDHPLSPTWNAIWESRHGSPASSSFRAEVYAPIVPFADTPTISERGERKKQISLYPLGVENHTQTCFMYPTRLPRRRHQIQPDMFAMPCQKYDLWSCALLIRWLAIIMSGQVATACNECNVLSIYWPLTEESCARHVKVFSVNSLNKLAGLDKG